MKTAKEVNRLSDWRGDARVYELSEPLEGYNRVIVSAVRTLYSGEPETYIFGANELNEVVTFHELEGSFKGNRDHTKALNNAGYTIVGK